MADFTLLPDEPADKPETTAVVVVEASPTNEEKPKNKGGRPRIHPPKPPRDPNAPKNKGGRPRKNPLPSDDDDELKALVKKSVPSTELTAESANSVMGADSARLIQLLESGDDEGVSDLLMKRLAQSSILLMAKVEQNVLDTNGRFGVQNYNGLLMGLRELINDMQAARDRSAIGQILVEQVLRPAFMDVGMAIMQEFYKTQQDAKNILREHDYKEVEKLQKECRDRIGQHLHQSYEKMRDGVVGYLQR